MKILLIGAGSIGVYFCGRAACGGTSVEVVAHRELEKIRREGYLVESIAGNFSFRPEKVLQSAREASADIDCIVVATKVLPGVDRVGLLKGVADRPEHPPIILIQNGVGIENEIAAAFPENEIISAIAYIGASRREVNQVVHSGSGRLILGRFGGGIGKSEWAASLFRAGGIPCDVVENIALERWKKLLWNLPFNPVSVLGGGLNSRELCDGAAIEELCSNLMDEVIAVANACNVPLDRRMAEDQLEYTRNFPPYKTSMLQDFEAGRPLEVEAIIGNVLQLALEHGVAVPAIRCCAALLHSVNRKNLERL